MDNTEIHYLTYDPEEIFQEMNLAYIQAGGDILYPGDEKEMLLRGVQAMIVQVFAGVDAALRMDTLRYAVGDYLDIYGEKRNCVRLAASSARGRVKITFKADGITRTIAAGTALTADGERIYLLDEDVEKTGYEQEVEAGITCKETGAIGNGLPKGTQMQFVTPNVAAVAIVTTEEATGGQAKESDDAYRERIRTYGLASTTTGPQSQYESVAKNVSSVIIDARALNLGAGEVGVYLILAHESGAQAIVEGVYNALSAQNVRPLTDHVTVAAAKEKAYALSALCVQENGQNIKEALLSAAQAYLDWQNNTIGRAFNPDKLMAMLYQAGALRVTWKEESAFDGGAIAYTQVDADTRCTGEVKLEVVDE